MSAFFLFFLFILLPCWRTGVKVSRNAVPELETLSLECSSCKIIGFHSWNLHSWGQQVSNFRYSNLMVNESFKFHIFTIINSQCWLLLQNFIKLKKKHEIMLTTFSWSLIIWEPAVETWAQLNSSPTLEIIL